MHSFRKGKKRHCTSRSAGTFYFLRRRYLIYAAVKQLWDWFTEAFVTVNCHIRLSETDKITDDLLQNLLLEKCNSYIYYDVIVVIITVYLLILQQELIMNTKKAVSWFFVWLGLAAIFNIGVYFLSGFQKALEFLGGYIIEQSLSLDNLFLFLVIFNSFHIDRHCQRKVLTYGIVGAVILRLIFIVLGVTFVNKFHWLLYVFGIVLLITGIKVLLEKEKKKDYNNSKLLKVLKKFIRFTDELEGDRFFVRKNRLIYATPLLAILILIEGSDIVFAIDSVPAVFSITTDTLIVYSSNIFAILGLRNLYFLLEKVSDAFKFVKHGVAIILIFTGVKLTALFFHIEIPVVLSIAIIFLILLICIIASMIYKKVHGKNA